MQPISHQPNTNFLNSHQTQRQASTIPPLHLLSAWSAHAAESVQVDWLIQHFNHWFAHHHVMLVRGDDEPEYFPASNHMPAQIMFAHGYFASALHEISHWCIAGAHRRTLPDLGYWYAPDGRSAEQQQLFEQVEVKPQALEWLLSQACGMRFRVSLDNLNGDAGSGDHFKDQVQRQVIALLSGDAIIPRDAQRLIAGLILATRPNQPLHINEFGRELL